MDCLALFHCAHRASAALALAALVAIAVPARAQLRDVTVGADGARAQLAIHFAAPPQSAQAAPDPSGVRIQVQGAQASAAVWRLVPGGPASDLTVTPAPDGAAVTVATRAPVLAAQAFVRGDAVIVDITLAEAVAGTVRGASRLYAGSSAIGAPQAGQRARPAPAASEPPVSASPVSASPLSASPVSERASARAAPASAAQPPSRPTGGAAPDTAALAGRLVDGLTTTACQDARAAVAADPWDLERLAVHGACLVRADRPADAEEVFARLLTFQPDNLDAQLGLGLALLARGRREDARDVFQDALDASVTDAAAARARAFLDALGPPPTLSPPFELGAGD